jgi:signal transduction histidine kinase
MPATSSQLRAVGTAFLLKRPLVVAPGVILAATLLWIAGVPRAQLVTLHVCFGTMLAFFCVEAWYGRTRKVGERWLSWSLRITLVALSLISALSGGLRSPFVPLLLAPLVVAFAAFGRDRKGATMAGLFTVLVLGLASIPVGRPWAPIPSPFDIGMTAGATIVTLALAYVGVAQLSDTLVGSRESLLRMREDALQSANDRLRSLETIGSKVAHELKNPLASIKGLAQLSSRGAGDERAHRRLQVLLAAATRMEEVLADYLSFARPLDELREEPLDLDRLVDDAIDLVEVRAQDGGVRIAREGTVGSPFVGDRRRLLDALLNVLTNAVEASARGGVVQVRVEEESDRVRLCVEDHGSGITAADLSRLGTPYFTTKAAGTGLGVVIAMSAARQHGGELRFQSALGRGTTAVIELPLRHKERELSDGARAGGR